MTGNPYIFPGVRLQARLGQRLDERDWQRLSSIRDAQHLIDSLLQTPAVGWVRGLDGGSAAELAEQQLRLRLGEQTEEIARWYPRPWRAAIRWTRTLPWLDSLRRQQTAPGTGELLRLASTPLQSLTDAQDEAALKQLRETDFAPLLPALGAGENLYRAWYDHWLTRWPEPDRTLQRHLADVGRRLRRAHAAVSRGEQDPAAASLLLLRPLHQHVFTPVAPFAFLAIQALDLTGLRRLLVDRLLFTHGAAA
ncbi:hypothetical protein [Thiohalobacter thiocyanaticus]|uniref:Uncharacterized protein n=1 Tax=Thiohalobacter thiocyanaticus TaxID=585455 RepID=A0A426QE10_9GAMM|nr:hypothetical protein [Thiohalobacter thiocyanaticus]RRQ20005.1 hypothetical protein D6C00_14695 [Thiohalobacter thiocyanaticus]